MEFSQQIGGPIGAQESQVSALKLDFSYKKLQALVTNRDNEAERFYIIDFNLVRSKDMIFHRADNEKDVIADTAVGVVSINPTVRLHGEKLLVVADSRLDLKYSYPSAAFSDTPGVPVLMTWTSSSNFKTWDFILLDPSGIAVAKFTGKYWHARKFCEVELVGDCAGSTAARDEILVTGLSIYYQSTVRTMNWMNLFGSAFYRKDKHKAELEEALRGNKEAVAGDKEFIG